MEDQFDLEGFTLRDIRALRMALDTIQINGIDANFIGTLQQKLNSHIQSIETQLTPTETPIPPVPAETN